MIWSARGRPVTATIPYAGIAFDGAAVTQNMPKYFASAKVVPTAGFVSLDQNVVRNSDVIGVRRCEPSCGSR